MNARLDMVGMVVQDLGRSLEFYRQLNLDIPADADEEPHVEVTLPGGLRLAWDTVETVRSFDPDWVPRTGGHSISLAFLLDTPADVDQLHDKLVSMGHKSHKEPWDAFWGQRYAVILDPDGNPVDLFAPLGTG